MKRYQVQLSLLLLTACAETVPPGNTGGPRDGSAASSDAPTGLPDGPGSGGSEGGPPADARVGDALPPPPSGVNVVTNRYDNGRTGVNSAETTLNPGAVDVSRFGLLFSRP